MSVETWTGPGRETPPAAAQPARGTVKLGPADVALRLWRDKVLMFLIFLPIALLGVGLALMFPTKYAAGTRLLVTLGEEYVFDPVVGEAARGAFPQQEEVLQAEAELASSPVIAERVLEQFGIARLYPDLAPPPGVTDARQREARDKAVEAFGKDLSAYAAPKSSILRLSYSHRDPQMAADVLNAFVKTYLTYRREVLVDRAGKGLGDQRGATETRLKQANTALQTFLASHGISDFDAEKTSVTKLLGTLSDDLSSVEASQREAEGRARGLTRKLNATPEQVDLYTETTSEQDLLKLKIEREDLLTRYKPDSRAVQDIDKRITQMEAFLGARPPQGLRRIGPNPTFQAIESDLAAAEATAAALSGRAAELRRQREAMDKRRAELASIEPDYLRLARDRDAIDASAKTLAGREQTERARSELAAGRADNISIYEPARAPTEGSSPKRLVIIAGVLLGLLTALMIGLLRAMRAKTFPTAGSLERTLGVRVLASVGER